MTLINLTPHPITCIGDKTVTFSPSGRIARITEHTEETTPLDGMKCVVKKYGEVTNLPPEKPDTIFIVSVLVLGQLPLRKDIVAPDTGPDSVIRNYRRRILGVRRFQRN